MTRFILPSSLLLLFILAGFRQVKPGSPGYGDVDTLRHYSVSLSRIYDRSGTIYKLNGKEVTLAVYSKYQAETQNLASCAPCYLRTYDADDKLLYEGMQHGDCRVGDFRIFHIGGTIKSVGAYRENHTGKWNDIYDRGYCSVKQGEWKYFSADGKDSLQEYYVNGQLVKTTRDHFFIFSDTAVAPGALMRTSMKYFNLNETTFYEEGYSFLDSLTDFLKAQPGITIEIGVHSDARTSTASSTNLTVARARSIRDYLVKEGIAHNRISAVGYTDKSPLYPAAEIEKLKNKGEQEFFHSQNRRLELKVVSIKR
jgi:outer membrane protein OmpA-like peptidoglycan-associated protein